MKTRRAALARSIRVCLAAAALAAVSAASLLDGDAPDFVAGGDGEGFVRWTSEGPIFSAAADPRSDDLCAARKGVHFLPACAPAASGVPVAPEGVSARSPALAFLPLPDPFSPRAPPRA